MAHPLSEERIREIARRYRPKGWRVRESKHRWAYSSACADNNTKTLYVPSLIDEESLFLYLHECGHVKAGHFFIKPLAKHREEFEAEQYACHIFRNEGIRLSHDILERARMRLRGWIDYDRKRGVKIQWHVARWAKCSGE